MGLYENGGTVRGKIPIWQREVGWPAALFYSLEERTFEFARDRDPIPVPHVRNESISPLDWDFVYLELDSADTTINRWCLWVWRAMLTELAGVQMVALLTTAFIAAFKSRRRKHA
jgi:hypothetical protein